MVNPTHFTYRVIWSQEDGEFVGLCAEFPSLSHIDETQGAALEGITNLVTDVVADMAASGEIPPAPIADREYSGRFHVDTRKIAVPTDVGRRPENAGKQKLCGAGQRGFEE